MRIFNNLLFAVCIFYSCGLVEDSEDIPEPGIYTSVDGRDGYESRLTISKKDKGYAITLSEYRLADLEVICEIEATGKKSSYGIWVEVPAYGPRLPIIIRKKDVALEVLLKGPDDPNETFTYCLTDRTPAGLYTRIMK